MRADSLPSEKVNNMIHSFYKRFIKTGRREWSPNTVLRGTLKGTVSMLRPLYLLYQISMKKKIENLKGRKKEMNPSGIPPPDSQRGNLESASPAGFSVPRFPWSSRSRVGKRGGRHEPAYWAGQRCLMPSGNYSAPLRDF